MSQNMINKVYEDIDKNFEKYVKDLQAYLSQPSISATGEGIEETAQMTAEYIKKLGSKDVRLVRFKDGHPIVYGTIMSKNARRTLVLYNMYDVQPPEPLDEWISPPFAANIVDGK
ncbi:MAG: peptidase M20, partial [Nitrososphaeria archaeon]